MSCIKSRQHAVRRPVPTAIGLAFATLPGLALAQQAPAPTTPAPEAQTLPAVRVNAARQTENKAESENVKRTAPLLDTPQTITVIPARTLELQNKLSLTEALSSIPGITFGAGEGGAGYGDSINFRGYSANNNITTDGLRDSAQYNRSDLFNIEQVEIANGANSVTNGGGNVSGTIDLISKQPGMQARRRISGGLGTDRYARFTADVNQPLATGIAARVNLMAHRNDVPGRDVEKAERWGIAPSIGFGLGTPTTFTLNYFHQHDKNVPTYGVPYFRNAFNNGPLPGVDRGNYYGYANLDTQQIDADLLTGIFTHRFNDNLSLRSTTRGQRVRQETTVNPPQGTWCLASGINVATGATCTPVDTYTLGGPRGNTRHTTNTMIAHQTDLTSTFSTGPVAHTLVTGFSFSHESFRLITGNVLRNPNGATPNPTLPPMRISDPDHTWGGPVNFIITGKTNGEQDNAAVYAFDNIQFTPQWSLNAGLRYERSRGQSQATTAITTAGVETWAPNAPNSANLFSYRVGLVWKPVDFGSVYVAYGNSQTPSKASVNGSCTLTSTTGTANCSVEPEKARNIELGTKWDVLDKQLSLTGSIFRNGLTNYRVTSGDPINEPDQQTDGESQVDGLALGAAGKISPQWGIFANYTYLRSKVIRSIAKNSPAGTVDPQAGNPLTNTPKHSGSMWVTYQPIRPLTLGYGVTYQGSWYLNNAAGVHYKADGYVVHSAMALYQVLPNLELQLNIKNLTDKTYDTRVRNNGWAVPGDARAATLTANYTF